MFKDPFDPKSLLGRRCGCGGDHSRVGAWAPDGRSGAGGRGGAVEPGRRCRRPARGLPGRRPAPAVPEDGGRRHGDGRDLLRAAARRRPRGLRPGRRAGEEGPQGRLHPHHLRHAHHHGPSDGLLFQAWAGRRSGEDGGLGGDPRQVAGQGIRRRAHALADAARHLAGRRLEPGAVDDAGDREHQRPGDHLGDEAQGQARSRRTGRASSSPCRSTTRCTTTCCATTWPSTGSIPTRTSRSARCRRPRWWPTCGPTISTAISVPIRSTSARSMTAWASSISSPRNCGTAIRAAPSPSARNSPAQNPNAYRALLKAIIEATAYASKAGEPQGDRQGDRAAELPEPARDGARADPDRHLRRRPGQR